jgi:hypothetical protein
MDEWEERIRTKVHASEILTEGEWVYLVGVFVAAREYDDAQKNGRFCENGHVLMPQSVEEAKGMILVAENYLALSEEHHSHERHTKN